MVDIPFQTQFGQVVFALNGQFAPGQTLQLQWTGVRKDTPNCGRYGYAVLVNAVGGDALPEQRYSLNVTNGYLELPLTQPATELRVTPYADSHCSTGALLGCVVQVAGAAGYCAYGTRKKTSSPTSEILTVPIIAALLAKYSISWWQEFVIQVALQAIDYNVLCGTGPGPFPDPHLEQVEGSAAYWWAAFKYVLWLEHCECVPGAPAPLPPPNPGTTAPIGWPTSPSYPCSNTDLCAAIVALAAQLGAMQRSQLQINELVTLLQRYGLPFAYNRGVTHLNLPATGSFAVSRLVGMEVDITTVPTPLRTLEGQPEYIWDLGWMSVMDGNGFIEEKRITRGRQIWMPKLMQEALTFGWFFKDGVSGTFTELEAEP